VDEFDKELNVQLKLLKDVDFQRLHQSLPIHPKHADDFISFLAQIRKDTKFLHEQNIMDYSLLLLIVKNKGSKVHNGKYSLEAKQFRKLVKGLPNSFCFLSRQENYLITFGLIDYLQLFDIKRNIQGMA